MGFDIGTSDDDEKFGGSINALGLNCHCFVDSIDGCLFLSGRGGTAIELADEVSKNDEDDVKVDKGLGGGMTGIDDGDIGFWSWKFETVETTCWYAVVFKCGSKFKFATLYERLLSFCFSIKLLPSNKSKNGFVLGFPGIGDSIVVEQIGDDVNDEDIDTGSFTGDVVGDCSCLLRTGRLEWDAVTWMELLTALIDGFFGFGSAGAWHFVGLSIAACDLVSVADTVFCWDVVIFAWCPILSRILFARMLGGRESMGVTTFSLHSGQSSSWFFLKTS